MLGTQVANYRIDDRLGEGGMGVVYKAIDLNLDRPVALKFLSAELGRDPGLIQRFQSEARSQANLNHTNIATLYNFINVDGNWLIAMEYIDGETLEQAVRRAGAMPYEDAIPLFKQALLGVGFAHRMGIVHRDIKPANIMVNRYGIVKVMDFGIAKVLSARNLTRTGVSVGTVAYMSPEQIKNSGVDGRSDIYSLGVTLYEMLTARLPFNSDSDYQIQYDHVNTPPPALSVSHPQIPRGIEAAVLRAMEKNPGNRFATVEEFGAALESQDVVPGKYQKQAQAQAGVAALAGAVAANASKKTVVEGSGGAASISTRAEGGTAPSFVARLGDRKFWSSREGIIAVVVLIAIAAAGFGITFWPKSNTGTEPSANLYSGGSSSSTSSSTSQAAGEQASQESGAPATLEMPSARKSNGAGNRALGNRSSTSQGQVQQDAMAVQQSPGPGQEQKPQMDSGTAGSGNVEQPTVSQSTTPAATRASAGSAKFTISVRHFHTNAGNAAVTFSTGQLTVSPSGSLTYQCTSSPNPKGCGSPVSIARENIKSANLNPNGGLRVMTLAQGVHDFYGDHSALVRARETILNAARQSSRF
jgi:serine/threonine protein kinase